MILFKVENLCCHRTTNVPWKSCKKLQFFRIAITQLCCHGRTTHLVSRIKEALLNTGSDCWRSICSRIQICEWSTQPVLKTSFRRDMQRRPHQPEFQERLGTFPTMLCFTQPSQEKFTSYSTVLLNTVEVLWTKSSYRVRTSQTPWLECWLVSDRRLLLSWQM